MRARASKAPYQTSQTGTVTVTAGATTRVTITLPDDPTLGTFKVTVLDQDNRVLTGVTVLSTSSPVGANSFNEPTLDGVVVFRGLKPGTWSISAFKNGYIPLNNTIVNIDPATTTEKTLKLQAIIVSGQPNAPGFPIESILIGTLFCLGFYAYSRAHNSTKFLHRR